MVRDGGRTLVRVEPGRGEDLRRHLAGFGVEAVARPGDPSCDLLVFPGDADRHALQAAVDRWPG